MRFLVDENLPKDVADILEVLGADVIYVSATELAGRSDAYLNALAISEDRVIVTRDLDFPLQQEQPPPGIVLLRLPDHYRRPEIRAFMQDFVTTTDLATLSGQITVIAPGREPRSRPIHNA